MSAIQTYVRTTAARGRETERIGPFLATYTPDSTHPMLNYAIPDDGAAPSADVIAALTEAFRGRELMPRLEYFSDVAPELEKLLVDTGFELERRVPLMVCSVEGRIDHAVPEGIRLREPETDEDFRRMRSAQNVAFGESPAVTDAEVARAKASRAAGSAPVLAEDTVTGEVIGGGIALEIVEGTTEIAGIAVIEQYRLRGIAVALTSHITREAHRRGAHTAFLTPGDLGLGNLYARVGYRPAGECVHLSLS